MLKASYHSIRQGYITKPVNNKHRKQANNDGRRAHVPPLVRKSTSSPCTVFPRMACAPARGGESPSGTCGRLLRERRDTSQGDNSASPEMSEETTRTLTRIYTRGVEEAPIPRVGAYRHQALVSKGATEYIPSPTVRTVRHSGLENG